MSLAVSRANPKQVYLAGHEVFQMSTDAGATWSAIDSGLPGLDIHAFTMDPDDPNRLTAFVAGRGTFRSADGGRTWDPLGARLPADVTTLASAGGNPEVLYVGSQSRGVLKTTDGGQTFATVGGLDADVLSLAVDPTAPQTVYAGVTTGRFQGGIAKTTDGGQTWRQLPFPGPNAVAVAVSPANPNVVLAIAVSQRQGPQAPSQGLVFRTQDGGQSWGSGGSST